ncbi:MAG: hypothetical protein R3336_10100 [Phycisphaeraceae bacterium]|nr:hypothetical protein [Phycisphaeraceae bacterium]
MNLRWPVYVLAAGLAVGLSVGLRTLWGIPDGGGATPWLPLILVAFVATFAQRREAIWAGLLLGLVWDLVHPGASPVPMIDAVIVGPAALGLALAAWVVVQLRAIVFRDSSVALATMVLVAGIFAHLLIVVLLTVRAIPWVPGQPLPGWDAADQLMMRFWELLYTSVVAIPVGWGLIRTRWIWGLHDPGRRSRRRR